MSDVPAERSAPAFDEATYKNALGLKKKSERDFAESLVLALAKLDRALLPPAATHPLSALIADGPRSIDQLLSIVEKGTQQERLDAVDALAHVLLGAPSKDAAPRLRAALKDEDDATVAALLEKTLAIAGDENTLIEQLKRLADPDPAIVASAARLLGFGRYKPAVPALKGLVSPERFFESRWVIWALGEIGDPAGLPPLEQALSSAFRVVDCLIAIGKIGKLTSIPLLTPHLIGSFSEQKDAAVRGLAMILDKNRDDARYMGAVRDQLAQMIERDLADPNAPMSSSTRFHMLLCLARLGVKLDESRTRKYLGVTLDPKDTKHVGAFSGNATSSSQGASKGVFSRATPAAKPKR